MTQYSTTIQLPIAQVWEHLIYKIEHPENFVPGVSNVTILENTEEYVIRSMDIHLPDGSDVTVVEKITHTPYLVRFTIIEHPVFTGYVDNLAERITDQETQITYTMHWVNRTNGEPMANPDIVKNAVLKTVDFMLQAPSKE